MRQMLVGILVVTASLATACGTVQHKGPNDYAGTDVEKIQTVNRPFEIGADIKDEVIKGESSRYSLLGLFSWGDDMQFSTPLIKQISPVPLPLDANPLRNAIGRAVNDGNADGIFITNVQTETFRLLDFGTDAVPEEGAVGAATYPIRLALLPLKFLEGLYQRQTVKVTGKKIMLKPLGVMSEARYDNMQKFDAKLDEKCCLK